MAEYRSPQFAVPHRKPLPTSNTGLQFHSADSAPSQYRPGPQHGPSQGQYPPRTASANYPPQPVHPQQHHVKQMAPAYPQHQQQLYMNPGAPVRRLSSATTSTTSTGNGNTHHGHAVPHIQTDVRRSSSSRSASPQVGYVALMRKQKATVWCDRAQPEDPRLAAQRRAAKHRAMLEVQGSGSGRSSTLASGGKIRHNATGRSMSYTTGTMVGAAVPLRLSANEVGDGDDEDDRDRPMLHRRTGSGRSSTNSNRFRSGYERPQQTRFSSGSSSTPPNQEAEIPEIVETPAPVKGESEDYTEAKNNESPANNAEASATTEAERPGSSYSFGSEPEDSFGKPTEMKAPSGAALAAQKAKTADELRRRGSVDDRTTTMTGVRLFIANPDLSD